jgi:voltage-gated sodium channel type XI alpha
MFILIGSFFLLNLFVGALCYNFDKAQKNEKSIGYLFMTPEQAKWIEMTKLLVKAKPEAIATWTPTSGYRLFLYGIVTSNVFEVGIMAVILANIILMTLDYEDAPADYLNVLSIFNYVFAGIFMCEMLIKIGAMTFCGYLSTAWNKFDFFIVMASIVDIITNQVGAGFSLLSFGP